MKGKGKTPLACTLDGFADQPWIAKTSAAETVRRLCHWLPPFYP